MTGLLGFGTRETTRRSGRPGRRITDRFLGRPEEHTGRRASDREMRRMAESAAHGRPRWAGTATAERPGGTPYEIGKRALDVAAAVAGLTVTAPLTATLAWRIHRADGGPVFYRGQRIGRGGVPFAMLKFRTMVVDASRLGGDSTAADDPRLTEIGRRLRRWKLDELPQLINVLRGEMSLVGPRPQVAWDVARYTADERRLLDVRPGITDWASIVFRNEGEILAGHADADRAYDELIRPRKIALGLHYVEARNLRTDLRILWLTGLAVLGHPRVEKTLRRLVHV